MRRSCAIVVIVSVAALGACSKKKTTSTPGLKPDATITMQEYAYLVTGTVKAGGAIKIRNTGQQFHMIGLAKLKDGKTLADATAALKSDGEDDDKATFDQLGMPGSFVGPGQGVDVAVPSLAAGHYAMACFVNVEGEQTPHFLKGMVGEFQVVTADAAATPTADATYAASKGKAITGPASLTAGAHVLKIERDAGGSVLEPGLTRLDAGKTVEDFAKAIKVFDEGLPVNAASKLPGQIVVALFDFEDATSVYIGVDLTPGTYVLVADDSDAENNPDVPVEKIVITVT